MRFLQIKGVSSSLVEVDVEASTRVGKGPPASTRVTLTNEVPGAIYSHGGFKKVYENKDISLSCGHVGDPVPRLTWKYKDEILLEASLRKNIQDDGALVIRKAIKGDEGNYTCMASNRYGSDEITHTLLVLTRPKSPAVSGSSLSISSLLIKWTKVDSGGSPVTGFELSYRKDSGIWNTIEIHRNTYSHKIKVIEFEWFVDTNLISYYLK